MSVFGNVLLIASLAAALFAGVAFLLGARRRLPELKPARYGVYATAALLSLAVLALLIAFSSHDYSLRYVYEHSANETPPVYLVSALWAGNEGALLFWGWLTSLGAAALLARRKPATEGLLPAALPVVLAATVLFLILTLTANPFAALPSPPADGFGLNPLLQNPGMVFHPPLLLAGWALVVVPFALAIGALATKRLGNEWLGSARRWALLAWLALGLGNLIGMWWAYVELGWGGYWAWDPVENAGLMPWLLLTAFLHSTMMQRRRGLLKGWSLFLVIAAFTLTIVGAWVERANIASVHTFGDTPQAPILGIAILVTVAGALWLLISRRRDIKEEAGDEEFVSGETTFLVNNLLFSAIAFVVLVLTLLPWLSRIFTGSQPVIGPGIFNTINLPLFLAVLLLLGVCLFVGWKRPDLGKLGRGLLWPAVIAVALVLILLIAGVRHADALAGLFILAFAFAATLLKWGRELAARHRATREGYFTAFRRLLKANGPRYGGLLIHLGILIMALGILGSTAYKVTASGDLTPGQSVNVGGYTLTFQGLEPSANAAQTEMIFAARIDVSRNGQAQGALRPENRYNQTQDVWTSEVAIRSSLASDLYISLDAFDAGKDTVTVTARVNPLVAWIWIGGAVILLGGLTSFYAAPRRETAEEELSAAGRPAARSKARGK